MKFLSIILSLLICFAASAQNKSKAYLIADSLQDAGKFSEALPYYEKALKADPNNELVLRGMGMNYIMLEKYDLGEKYYNEALKINPSCAPCYRNLGMAYAQKGDLKKSLEYTDKAISLDPKDPHGYLQRGKIKAFSGDKFGALRDYNKALELEPKNPDIYYERGNYNLNAGYSSLALDDYAKVIELAPDSYMGYYSRANVYYNEKLLTEALADMNKAIKLDSTIGELYTARGAVLASMNEKEKAIADYNKAIQLDPDPMTYFNRSMVKYDFEDMDGSCEDLLKSRSMIKKEAPDHEMLKTLDLQIGDHCDSGKVSYYYQRGIACYNLGQFDKAVQVYTRGLKKFPGSPMCLSFRGNAYYAMSDHKNALADYTASIASREKISAEAGANARFAEAAPAELDAYVTGFISTTQVHIAECKLALGYIEEALTDINKAIETAPNIKEYGLENYFLVRGNAHLALGKYKEAIEDFDRCIIYDPTFFLPYVNRAIARINMASPVKMMSSSFNANLANGQTVSTGWMLPVKISTKKNDANLNLALSDCNKATELDPQAGYAFYVKGYVKQMLALPDYCYDYLKAKTLQFPVEPELVKGCVK
jgi:tetratricopeptide (TPR) repeat protein